MSVVAPADQAAVATPQQQPALGLPLVASHLSRCQPTGEQRALAVARLGLHGMATRKIGPQPRFEIPVRHRCVAVVISTAVIGESSLRFQPFDRHTRHFYRHACRGRLLLAILSDHGLLAKPPLVFRFTGIGGERTESPAGSRSRGLLSSAT